MAGKGTPLSCCQKIQQKLRPPLSLPIVWKQSQRAKRLSLRIDPIKDAIVVTLPPNVSQHQGMIFVQENMNWIEKNISALPPKESPTNGHEILIQGKQYRIINVPTAHRACWLEERNLFVSGLPEHTERRVKDFLRSFARSTLSQSIKIHSEEMKLYPSRIDFRDTRSRWGSCTRQGRIMLNWRLIMAPPEISRYVIIHELAHLKYFNHGSDFWALVEKNYEKNGTKRLAAERWLSNNGARLLRLA